MFIVLGENEDALRKYLLWQQVFSINLTLSFSIHEGLPGQLWQIMVLTGAEGAVIDVPSAKKEVLMAVCKRVWADINFCVYAANLVAKHWGVAGSMAVLAKMATDSMDITCV